MIKSIEKTYNERRIVSIYSDRENTDKHFTGYIGAYNDTEILIEHISPRGLYDGYIFISVDDIYQLDCGGLYERKIEKLYQMKRQAHESIEIKDNAIFYSMVKFAQRKGFIVYAELQDSAVRGFVRECDEDTMRINAVTEYGNHDGICEIRTDEIKIFSVDTEDEQDLLLLL